MISFSLHARDRNDWLCYLFIYLRRSFQDINDLWTNVHFIWFFFSRSSSDEVERISFAFTIRLGDKGF